MPRDRVGLAQALAQPLAHEREQAVAGGMAEAVVDRLEAVEVEDHHREQALVAPRPGQRALEAVLEQRAVGEAREIVELRLLAELLGAALARQRIADRALEPDRVEARLVEEIGDAERHRLQVELERAVLGQHHQRRAAAALLRGAHQLEAAAVGQRRVDQADVEAAAAQPLQAAGEIARAVDHEHEMRRGAQQALRAPASRTRPPRSAGPAPARAPAARDAAIAIEGAER